MTPHISAKKKDISKIVLMPGDPLRAKFMAQMFLTDLKLVSSVRNSLIYTGKYKNVIITIAASGMGQPSMGIYSYELFKFYDVETIIRIGSAGSYLENLKVKDIVLAKSSFSDSNIYNLFVAGKKEKITFPSQKLNDQIIQVAKKNKIKLNILQIHSSDVFYALKRTMEERIKTTQASCVEMESYALFINANLLNKKAACILTISDNLISKKNQKDLTFEEREKSFVNATKIALEAVIL